MSAPGFALVYTHAVAFWLGALTMWLIGRTRRRP